MLGLRPVDVPMFNRAMGIGLRAPATEAEVAGYVTHFSSRGSKGFRLQASPISGSRALPDWFRSLGLQARSRWAKMYRGTGPVVTGASDLEVAEVGPEAAGDFSRAVLAGYGMPPFMGPWLEALVGRPGWRAYVAYDGRVPVGAGALHVEDGAGWLGVAATIAAYRGRGAQSAIMARRIRDAIALGCTVITTETGEDTPENPNPSYRNMLRAGFQLGYLRENWGL